jgi:hypothetical protein
MIGSYRVSLAIALLATTASILGAPLAHASSPMHFSGNRSTIHSQERFRPADRHLPSNYQAPPQQHVEDPFADMILG